MAQSPTLQTSTPTTRLIFGFTATLLFHQIGLLLLHYAGVTQNFPYNMRPVPPLCVPQFISLAFWAGCGASSLCWSSAPLRVARAAIGSAPSFSARFSHSRLVVHRRPVKRLAPRVRFPPSQPLGWPDR